MYIDPNTGGMLFQIAGFVIALFSGIVLLFSGKIRAAIARARRMTRQDEPASPAESRSDRLPLSEGPQDDEARH